MCGHSSMREFKRRGLPVTCGQTGFWRDWRRRETHATVPLRAPVETDVLPLVVLFGIHTHNGVGSRNNLASWIQR
ncbi:hypothetical protein GN956_G17256 [Arapaima gigas]